MSRIQNHPNLTLYDLEFPTFHPPWFPFPWNAHITSLILNSTKKQHIMTWIFGCSIYISHQISQLYPTIRIHYKDKLDTGWSLLISCWSRSLHPIPPTRAGGSGSGTTGSGGAGASGASGASLAPPGNALAKLGWRAKNIQKHPKDGMTWGRKRSDFWCFELFQDLKVLSCSQILRT